MSDATLKSLQNKMAAIAHRQSYFAGKLEPAHAKRQAMVIQLADARNRESLCSKAKIPLRRKGRELRLPRFICRQSATMAHAAPVDLHLRVLGSG